MQTSDQHSSLGGRANSLFDEDGFLYDGSSWTEQLASDLADLDGVGPLTPQHLRVIMHVREKFFRLGGVPAMRLVCRETKTSRWEIHALFGSCRAMWRLAGLPNPGEEAKAYFD